MCVQFFRRRDFPSLIPFFSVDYGNLPARAAVTLLKFSYNSRMDDLRKTSSEAAVSTGIFAEYDALIDSAVLSTGIADD